MISQKKLFYLVLMLLLWFLSNEFLIWQDSKRAELEVFFLDIGQGDAILISYQRQYQILIDGGPSPDKLVQQLDRAMPLGDKTIELVILTHPDLDHATGLIGALNNYQVKLFLDNGQISDQKALAVIQQLIVNQQIERKIILAGSEIEIDNKLKLKSFNPLKIIPAGRERNDQSVVLRMDYQNNSFLFTGDAEKPAERMMIKKGFNLKADWLKVGHHGSKSSSSAEFLKRVTPRYAIISVGKENRYGHPTEEVLMRLKKIKTKILRTDQQGTIRVSCRENQKCLYE